MILARYEPPVACKAFFWFGANRFHCGGLPYFNTVDWEFTRPASGSKFQSVGHGGTEGVVGDTKHELGSCVLLGAERGWGNDGLI